MPDEQVIEQVEEQSDDLAVILAKLESLEDKIDDIADTVDEIQEDLEEVMETMDIEPSMDED